MAMVYFPRIDTALAESVWAREKKEESAEARKEIARLG
jgi:hypothetical protein